MGWHLAILSFQASGMILAGLGLATVGFGARFVLRTMPNLGKKMADAVTNMPKLDSKVWRNLFFIHYYSISLCFVRHIQYVDIIVDWWGYIVLDIQRVFFPDCCVLTFFKCNKDSSLNVNKILIYLFKYLFTC